MPQSPFDRIDVVTHPLLGEVFFQTGRFCAAEEIP